MFPSFFSAITPPPFPPQCLQDVSNLGATAGPTRIQEFLDLVAGMNDLTSLSNVVLLNIYRTSFDDDLLEYHTQVVTREKRCCHKCVLILWSFKVLDGRQTNFEYSRKKTLMILSKFHLSWGKRML